MQRNDHAQSLFVFLWSWLKLCPSYFSGLRVVGGQAVTVTGRLGATITKVKKGSIADTVGHLMAGMSAAWLASTPETIL